MRLSGFSSILFRVKVPGFRSGTVCVCVCVVPPWRDGLGPVGKRETSRRRVTGFDMKQQESWLSLFRSKSRHNAICCWVPSLLHRMRFGSCSLCKQEMVAVYVLFMEIKCQEQSPEYQLCSTPRHTPRRVLGWSLEKWRGLGSSDKERAPGLELVQLVKQWHQLGGKYWCTLFVFEPEVWVLHISVDF